MSVLSAGRRVSSHACHRDIAASRHVLCCASSRDPSYAVFLVTMRQRSSCSERWLLFWIVLTVKARPPLRVPIAVAGQHHGTHARRLDIRADDLQRDTLFAPWRCDAINRRPFGWTPRMQIGVSIAIARIAMPGTTAHHRLQFRHSSIAAHKILYAWRTGGAAMVRTHHVSN